MEKMITKKEPDIIMVSSLELTGSDVLRLKHAYGTEAGGFTISSRGCDVILLNRDIESAEEIKGSGSRHFDATWTSSTERVALEDMAKKKCH